MIGYRTNFVFIHVPKTGGQSVAKALRPHALFIHQRLIQRLGRHLGRRVKYDYYGLRMDHSSVADYQAYMSPEEYSRVFSFGFVRNPWDRVLSMYSFTQKRPSSPLYDVAIKGSLDDFIAELGERGVTQQIDYFRDQNGEKNVNYIGRFENLDDSLAEVGTALGVTLKLPHKNASRHRPYREVYSDWGRETVERLYKDDISEFSYSFE